MDIETPSRLYAVGYSIDGKPWRELPLDKVNVTLNLNEPDVASLRVLVDKNWGVPTDPREIVPASLPNQLLQPWSACIGVFDEDTDELLFYGPIVKRRRQSRAGATGWNGGFVDLECKSWTYWLNFVYPELNWFADGSAAASESATQAVKELMWGVFYQDVDGDWIGGTGSEEERRASVAGRAGKQFDFMPIVEDAFDFDAEIPVYLSWNTVSPGSVAQTSAAQLIKEVTDQGVDVWCDTSLLADGSAVTSLRMSLVPDWETPPAPVATLVTGGNLSGLTVVDRGDLHATLVHVSGGSGETAEWPDWSGEPIFDSAYPKRLLVERVHPYQQHSSGVPIGTAALQDRGKILLAALRPSPREALDLESHDRLLTVRPGDTIQLEVPKGTDPAAVENGWEMLGRVSSISWGEGIVGCEVTFAEPGSDAATAPGEPWSGVPSQADFSVRVAQIEAKVLELASAPKAPALGAFPDTDWADLTLYNGWQEYTPTTWGGARYMRRNGIVYVSMMIKSGVLSTTTAILPVGFRPAYTAIHAGTAGSSVRWDVLPNGDIRITTGGSQSWSALQCSFPAEQ